MKRNEEKKGDIVSISTVRKIHRAAAAFLAVVFITVAVTGLLLGWKKNSNGYIHPDSYRGSTTDLRYWLPLDSLKTIALQVLHDSINPNLKTDLDRIDVRPDKGMVKFVFSHHYNGIQLDGATGRVLHLERRRSDLIEDIHDGSALDKLLGFQGEQFKLVYTSVSGVSLLVFTITGLWIWLHSRKKRARAALKVKSEVQSPGL
jgi:uncharacterized iron-regulated membrane protein